MFRELITFPDLFLVLIISLSLIFLLLLITTPVTNFFKFTFNFVRSQEYYMFLIWEDYAVESLVRKQCHLCFSHFEFFLELFNNFVNAYIVSVSYKANCILRYDHISHWCCCPSICPQILFSLYWLIICYRQKLEFGRYFILFFTT